MSDRSLDAIIIDAYTFTLPAALKTVAPDRVRRSRNASRALQIVREKLNQAALIPDQVIVRKKHTRPRAPHNSGNRYYENKYGISRANYYQLLADQDGKCAICRREHKEKAEKKWGRAKLAVDHDHVSGKIRGLLCYSCNVGLGHFKESPAVIFEAAEYISKNLPLKAAA